MNRAKLIVIIGFIISFTGCKGNNSDDKKKRIEKEKKIIHKLKSKEEAQKKTQKDKSRNLKTIDKQDIGNKANLKNLQKEDRTYTLKKLKRVPEAIPSLPKKLLKNKPKKRPEIPKFDKNSSQKATSDDCKSGKCNNIEKLAITR